MASKHYKRGRARLKLNMSQHCLPIAANGHFVLYDRYGNVDGDFFGYYFHDTRFLNRLSMTIDGESLWLRQFETDVYRARYVYTNKAQTLLVQREVVVHEGLVERLTITAFDKPHQGKLTVRFGADFRAMGEVRDMGPTTAGWMLEPQVGAQSVKFAWQGSDMLRQTKIQFSQTPQLISNDRAEFAIDLQPGASTQIEYAVSITRGTVSYMCPLFFDRALAAADNAFQDFLGTVPSIETGSPEFNSLLAQSLKGIYMLKYSAERGQFMAAGLPWYFTPFFRDACIWILQAGWLFPELAKNVLRTMREYQVHHFDNWTQARPGKIPHEVREDQLAHEKRFVWYDCCYAADTTPLYIVATCQMALWSNDLRFAAEMFQSLTQGDACITAETLEGFLVYDTEGRENKFWMEEDRSVTDADGNVPPAPKAVCDVEGFVFQARTLLARVADLLGKTEFANEKRRQADELKAAFQSKFWDEQMQYPLFAIGGVGEKEVPCRIYHTDALFLPQGLLTPEQEQTVAKRCLQPDLFTRWGILPITSKGRNFQPFFVQSQCVCPFHTVMGGVQWFLRNGETQAAHELMWGLVDASRRLDGLPELYVVPDDRTGPIRYAASQMACYPQLWTAGSVVQMVQLCADVRVNPEDGTVSVGDHASVPAWMGYLNIKRLRVMGRVVDIALKHRGDGTTSAATRVRKAAASKRKVA